MTESGEEVARVTGPQPMTYTPVCFSPDGTRLVAMGAREEALYVWDLRLIRAELKPIGLDWKWPDFKEEAPDTRGRFRLTVDTGMPAPQGSSATSPPWQEPTPEPGRAK
jgi:hypothetical protein